jgi:multidrug efflux system membrane fusion protein
MLEMDVVKRTTAAAALLAALLAQGCDRDAKSAASPNTTPAAPPVPVSAAVAASEDVPVEIKVIGNVEPFSTVSIKSQVEGQLARVHFNEGQEVKAGDLLIEIDPRPFEAALKRAEASLARDLAEANNASSEAERRASLFGQGFISRDENDQAQTRAASLRATVEADRAAVDTAKLELQYCRIRSPLDGRIGQILAHEGNVTKANETTLAVVNQIRPINVAFAVPEQELGRIRSHAAESKLAVRTTIRGMSARTVEGTLTFIDNAVNTTTGTVLLKAEFPNTDEALWPGQFVDVSLTLDVERGVVVVPGEAMQTGQQGPYLFVIKPDSTVEVRNVAVGRSTGSSVIVTSGLGAGERIVTDGQIRLAAGSKVQIRDGSAAPTDAPAQ